MLTLLSKTPTTAVELFCVITSPIRWLIFPTALSGNPTKALRVMGGQDLANLLARSFRAYLGEHNSTGDLVGL